MKKSILFICIHNSARSQMAEEILRKLAPDKFDVESAGIEPGNLNPFAVSVLREIGINIEGKKTQSVSELINSGKSYDYVIKVCDEANASKCPIFPGNEKQIRWGFSDPSSFEGSAEEKLAFTRVVREEIQLKIKEFIAENGYQQ
ncbi:MAG: arsenate reductase ArsC [Candidatus Zapsychrus exili]|nr:arsenate reductase ArsC [Candidatus Zapsychrus exili]